MTHEFHSRFPFALKDGTVQAFALQWLAGETDRLPHRWDDLALIDDPIARLDILAQAVLGPQRERARSGTRTQAGGYRLWVERYAQPFIRQQRAWMRQLGLEPALPDLTCLPHGALGLTIPFTLRKPYLSKDDVTFHILDNPVKKEWVFHVPYVAASQWKGALRAAMIRELVGQLQAGALDESAFTERRLRLYRLFGNEKDGTAEFLNRAWALHRVEPPAEDADDAARQQWQRQVEETIKVVADEFEQVLREKRYRVGDIEGFQGRLHFFPTFFDQIGLEVINPHDRETGVGARGPILIECMPQETMGELLLLYVPFGPLEKNEAKRQAEVAQDLEVLAQGVQAMLTTYGFGAKTSSGYGVAEDQLAGGGKLAIRAQVTCEAATTSTINLSGSQGSGDKARQLQTDIEQFMIRFGLREFPRWTNDELKRSDWGRKRQSEYKRLRSRHPDWNDVTGSWKIEPEERESTVDKAESTSGRPFSECTFRTLSELPDLAQRVAEALRKGSVT